MAILQLNFGKLEMKDQHKTKDQLIKELTLLRRRMAKLEEAESNRKITEEALRPGGNMLAQVVALIPQAVFWKDRNSVYLGCNEVFARAAGLVTPEEVVGKTDLDLPWPPAEAEAYRADDREVMERNRSKRHILEPLQQADGERLWIITTKVPLVDAAGDVFGVLGVYEDITERKLAEEELERYRNSLEDLVQERTAELEKANEQLTREMQERKNAQQSLQEMQQMLQSVLDNIPVRVFWKDLNSNYLGCNRPFALDAGLQSPADIIGKNDLEMIWADEAALYRADDRLVIKTGVPKLGYEEPQTAPDGAKIWLWTHKVPLLDNEGKIKGVLGTYEDITKSKLMEETLRASETRYRIVADNTYDWEYWKSPEGRFLYTSPSCQRITGYTADEFEADPKLFSRIVHPDDLHQFEAHVEEDQAKDASGGLEFRIIHRGGTTRWIGHLCQPVFDAEGRFIGRRGSNRDITDRKRAEEALQDSSRKLKIFAYSVAHDLKSPAIGIHGLSKRLNRSYRDVLDEKGRSYCDQILRTSEHIAALVDKVNVYIATKEAPLSIERISISEIIQMLRDEFSTQLSVRQIAWLEPEIAVEIKADRLSILRAFRNFVDNSLKYGGERLTKIWTGYKESGDFHIFSFRDNGKGLKGEDSENIFGAFQRNETSRGVEGAGLGLTIVKEIAEQHGGRVWVEPRGTKGTTFYLSISKNL
jgi:PAS domain S-box-containing protein